jgi:aldehyde dehydrogenase (NAD+)
MAPALCAGNTVICKPSEYTSASLLEFAKLVVEAGLPPGVVNVLTGFGSEVAEPLVRHRHVHRIAFTGGDEAGRRINKMAAEGFKRISLELGGKSPNIVFDDADMEQAVNGALSGIFSATGQTCVAGSRLLLQETIHDEFLERITTIARTAKAGDPADPKTHIGPMTTKAQFDKAMDYIDIATKEGARCVVGGRALTGPGYGAGQFVAPTIFAGVTNEMRIAQEEVFGPVLSVLKFRDEEDALRIANDTRFGLAAGVWTQSLHRAMVMTQGLRAGTVWVNNYRSSSYTTPFGGFKDSGIGREGGVDAVREYMEPKSVWISTDLQMANPFGSGEAVRCMKASHVR